MAIETIHYTVLYKKHTIEIRDYDHILLASTKTNPKNPSESGFNRVFKYISGQNAAHQKINMTSPVVTYQEGNEIITGFYVPSQYDKTTVPKPTGDVYIDSIEAATYVVITFYGAWTKANYDHHHNQLLEYIKNENLQIKSNPLIMRYSAPYVPDQKKRNEIAYQIKNYK